MIPFKIQGTEQPRDLNFQFCGAPAEQAEGRNTLGITESSILDSLTGGRGHHFIISSGEEKVEGNTPSPFFAVNRLSLRLALEVFPEDRIPPVFRQYVELGNNYQDFQAAARAWLGEVSAEDVRQSAAWNIILRIYRPTEGYARNTGLIAESAMKLLDDEEKKAFVTEVTNIFLMAAHGHQDWVF